ncbi:hypothetical protein BD311DRAFT_541274 [Dichomitus squalens]|uniref:Uncharacterized protein n=1 Tax=Dichomitus squalens TaxID=114155 RepID=A0A4Q9MFT0_9APHY|nr:hypothetical protein BD311DRAFT_541274 [Dichomitus squalens]
MMSNQCMRPTCFLRLPLPPRRFFYRCHACSTTGGNGVFPYAYLLTSACLNTCIVSALSQLTGMYVSLRYPLRLPTRRTAHL